MKRFDPLSSTAIAAPADAKAKPKSTRRKAAPAEPAAAPAASPAPALSNAPRTPLALAASRVPLSMYAALAGLTVEALGDLKDRFVAWCDAHGHGFSDWRAAWQGWPGVGCPLVPTPANIVEVPASAFTAPQHDPLADLLAALN